MGLGMKPIFRSDKNPLPWVDAMLGVTHTNFFEQRVVDYAKGALSGSWGMSGVKPKKRKLNNRQIFFRQGRMPTALLWR